MIERIAINIHGIGTPLRDLEPGEAPYWISEAQYAALLRAISVSAHRERIHITFDDGNISDLSIGLPGLLANGLTADFFVLTGRLDKAGSLGCDDVLALQAAGMGVGSHGVDHLDWSGLSSPALHYDIARSRDVLSALTGVSVTAAAVPFGRWNGAVLKALKEAGYERVWTSDGGPYRRNAFLRPRVSVRGDMSPQTFVDLVNGRLRPLARLRRLASMTHKRFLG